MGWVAPGIAPWGSGKEVTSPPPPPGSRGALLLPSPLRTTRKPFGLCRSSFSQGSLRNPVGCKSPPARYWSGADERNTPETAPAGKLLSSALSPKPVVQTVSSETPEGSRPAFAWSDLTRGLNPYPPCSTGRPSLPPSSSTRRPLGPPYGGPTPKGGRRAYHVPRTYQGWFRPLIEQNSCALSQVFGSICESGKKLPLPVRREGYLAVLFRS